MIHTASIDLSSKGHGHVLDITSQVARAIADGPLSDGIVTLFCPGSTGGLTTIEFEPGCVADMQRLFDEVAAPSREYKHHLTWGDDNGHAHVRAGLLGPSLTVPFVRGRLTLGTWQQIVFLDFDTRPRSRSLVAQLIGE